MLEAKCVVRPPTARYSCRLVDLPNKAAASQGRRRAGSCLRKPAFGLVAHPGVSPKSPRVVIDVY